MDINDLMMLDADEIPYGDLTDELLERLILDSADNFSLTGALTELENRHASLLSELVDHILKESIGDKYIQAQSFKILFELDKDSSLKYVQAVTSETPIVLLQAMIEMLTINIEELQTDLSLRNKVKGLAELAHSCVTGNSRRSNEARMLIDAFS